MTIVNVLVANGNEKVKECIVIPHGENDLEWGLRQALIKIYGGANVFSCSRKIGHIPDNISGYIAENYCKVSVKDDQWVSYTGDSPEYPNFNERVLVKLANEWITTATYVHHFLWKDDNGNELISVLFWKRF